MNGLDSVRFFRNPSENIVNPLYAREENHENPFVA